MNHPIGQALQILILGVLLILMSAAWFYWSVNYSSEGSLTVVICLGGAVGGVANNFRRLQKLPLHDWETLDSTTRWLMTLQIYVSPLIGALFAFVLYGIFAAEMLQGSLFPTFAPDQPEYSTLSEFANKLLPATNTDASKALVWAFIAGFAEGFVPNFIDKVAKEAQEADAGQGS